ncbi:hypothetical protein U1Q18_005488 [Sarracenia purpurea var. burkii]
MPWFLCRLLKTLHASSHRSRGSQTTRAINSKMAFSSPLIMLLAAKECKIILEIVESALPNGTPQGIEEDCKLQEMFHKALELLPKLWIHAGFLDDAITAYRQALVKPWNLDPQRLATVQKDLAAILLYGGVEASLPHQIKLWGPTTPKTNTEEAILLLFILMEKVLCGEIEWDSEIMDHLTFALSVCGKFEYLAEHVQQALPGTYNRAERWYFLALCYGAAGQNEAALNLLKKVLGSSEAKNKPHFPSCLLAAKFCSQDPKHAREGIKFARRAIEAIDLASHRNKHFIGQAHKFLGVCYGNAARVSVSDSERLSFHSESLKSLSHAASIDKEDPELMLNLGLENAVQRNLSAAFDDVMRYSGMLSGSSGRGWKLLALIVSAEQRLKDAETIVDVALDETGRSNQFELLRLKAFLQIAQEQPKQAIETYTILLALIQAQRDQRRTKFDSEQRRLEMEVWQDLAEIYANLGSWPDAETCLGKSKSTEFYSPRGWHATGKLLEAQARYKEALAAFTIALCAEPDFVPTIVSSAEVLMKMGSQSLPIARSFLMSALRLEPTNHEAWWNLGLVCKMEGSVQHAAEFFQAAHELMTSAPVQSFV